MNKSTLIPLAALALGLAGCDSFTGGTAASTSALANASSGTTVVTEEDVTRQPEGQPVSDNWMLYTRNAGSGAFISGPGSPPSGVGSLELVTPTGDDKVWLFNYDHIGTSLGADREHAPRHPGHRVGQR